MDFKEGEFEIKYSDGSIGKYEPLELHFREPSEHTIDGKHYDIEL